MDPHSSAQNADRAATVHLYEALLDIDSNLAIVPQLALAWKPLNSTTWEFTLRSDVRFHDGTLFTAEDVVFSIERARAKTSELREQVANVAAVEAITDHSIRITTAAPDPLLWMRLSLVPILSKAWAEAHDARVPAHMMAGTESYASRHANGTGPFVLEEFEPHGRWVVVRNPDWWAEPESQHNIDRIVHTWKDDAENLAALLKGQIDLLQAPLYSGIEQIRRNPDLKVVHRPKLYTAFFGLDQRSTELRSSNIKGKNPFKDRRVREAMASAIDLETVLRPLMGELFIPAGMMVAPGVNGYAPELDQPMRHDRDKARALLSGAGYADGFSVTLDCPSEWGDDDTMTCQGAAKQLQAVGIEVRIDYLSTAQMLSKVEQRHDSDFFLDAWNMDADSEGFLRDYSLAMAGTTWPAMPIRGSTSCSTRSRSRW